MKTNRSVERAMSVLMYVCQCNGPVGLTDISRGAGLDKATTLRLLNTLALDDMVRQEVDHRGYVPGSGIYNLWPNEIRKICRPYLQALERLSRETVCLISPRGRQRVCIDVIEPDRELRIVAPVGRAIPIYAGAAGKVFMAHKPDKEVETILAECDLPAYTIKSVTDRKTYIKQLPEIKTQGYAFTEGEVELETSAIAVPIFDSLENTAAAVVLRAPSTRMTTETISSLVPEVIKTALSISNELASLQN